MQISSISWKAIIDGKEYGNEVLITEKKQTNQMIKESVEIIAENMTESLQKVINGKSDTDIRLDEISIKKEF